MIWYIQHKLGELCRWVVPFYPLSCILKSYLYSHEWNYVEGNKVLQEKHARLIIFITAFFDVSSMMGIHKTYLLTKVVIRTKMMPHCRVCVVIKYSIFLNIVDNNYSTTEQTKIQLDRFRSQSLTHYWIKYFSLEITFNLYMH